MRTYKKLDGFRGNINLKNKNVKHQWTPHQILELKKCNTNIIYFIKTYCKIVSIDEGIIPFDLWDFQEELIHLMNDNRFVIACQSRQSGKSTTVAAWFLHYLLFNQNKFVAILANKSDSAQEILSRVQLMYELLPDWLQLGIVDWNKRSFQLENGSRIISASTSSSAIRGKSINILFLDEFAFVPKNVAEDFMRSVYPTISSGQKSKIFIVSTPFGLNHYHKLWVDSTQNRNTYVNLKVKWDRVPGRDKKWKEETIKNIGKEAFAQEYDIEFIGSAGTLIDPVIIRNLVHQLPLNTDREDNTFRMYANPIKNATYLMTVDTSEGLGLDAHAASIWDVSSLPYHQAAIYQDASMDPHLLPDILVNIAKTYNDAYILCEIKSTGEIVADIIWNQIEYENLLWTTMNGSNGQVLGAGGEGQKSMGVKTSIATKRKGCSVFKTLMENEQLIINDHYTISEISRFVRTKNTYKGQDGSPDDCVMTGILLAWVTNQAYFQNLIEEGNHDVRSKLAQDALDAVNEMLIPFGILDDNLEDTITGKEAQENFENKINKISEDFSKFMLR